MNPVRKVKVTPIILLFLATPLFITCGIKPLADMKQPSPHEEGIEVSAYPAVNQYNGPDTTFAKILIPDQG